MQTFRFLAVTGLVCLASVASAQLRITEFMSEGQGLTGPGSGGARQREFFELTNLGNAPVDVTNYSYNDNNTNDPLFFGSTFGNIAAGESVIMTQMTVADFRSYWGLTTATRIYSFGNLSNLGNADTINIYNSNTQNASTLVDTLTYTADFRGSGLSRNRPFDGGTGQYPNSQWIDSVNGDGFGSRFAPNPPGPDFIDLANPGRYAFTAPVPEPSSIAIGISSLLSLTLLRRKRKA